MKLIFLMVLGYIIVYSIYIVFDISFLTLVALSLIGAAFICCVLAD